MILKITQWHKDPNCWFICNWKIKVKLAEIINNEIINKTSLRNEHSGFEYYICVTVHDGNMDDVKISHSGLINKRQKIVGNGLYLPTRYILDNKVYDVEKYIEYTIKGISMLLEKYSIDSSLYETCIKMAKEEIVGNDAYLPTKDEMGLHLKL